MTLDRHGERVTAGGQRRTSAHPNRVCEPHRFIAAINCSMTSAMFDPLLLVSQVDARVADPTRRTDGPAPS